MRVVKKVISILKLPKKKSKSSISAGGSVKKTRGSEDASYFAMGLDMGVDVGMKLMMSSISIPDATTSHLKEFICEKFIEFRNMKVQLY